MTTTCRRSRLASDRRRETGLDRVALKPFQRKPECVPPALELVDRPIQSCCDSIGRRAGVDKLLKQMIVMPCPAERLRIHT
jgi:hypothetical protein